MKIFISWSGEQAQMVASALKDCIKRVIQAADPWVSTRDIAKGVDWFKEIAKQLEESDFGIICLTQRNLNSPWMLFEAGAIAKKFADSHTCPYLLDLKRTDVKDPYAKLQLTVANEQDSKELFKTINHAVQKAGGRSLTNDDFEALWAKFWPDLDEALADARKRDPSDPPKRHPEDMVEELLVLVRQLSRSGVKANAAGHIEPSSGNAFDLGSDAAEFRNGYFGSGVSVGSSAPRSGEIRLGGNRSITARGDEDKTVSLLRLDHEGTLLIGARPSKGISLANVPLGFFETRGVGRQQVAGSHRDIPALKTLLNALASYGLIIDASSG